MTTRGADNVRKIVEWLSKLPVHKQKADELQIASKRVRLTIGPYKDMSESVKKEIERNGFARNLILEKGGHHGGH